MRRLFVSLVAMLAVAVGLTAETASAHTGTITISCSKVTFTYSGFSNGATANETVSVDGSPIVSKSFTFSGSGGTDVVSISVSGSHTISAHADWTADGGGHADASAALNCPTPTCPGEKINFRWHYSANGSSGSWSGTKSTTCDGSRLVMGPQAMEGDLKVSPGTILKAGYDFTIPGNNTTRTVTVNNPKVVFTVGCVSGATPSSPTLTVSMPTQSYTATGSAWYPSGDQHSSLVYQGHRTVPNLCSGGQLRLNQGGTFSAVITA